MSAPAVPESTGGHADVSYASTSGTQPGTSASQDGQPSFCLQSQHLQANDNLVSMGTTMSTQGIVPESCFIPPYAYYYQTPNISSRSFMERGASVVPPSERSEHPFPQIYGMEKCIPQQQSSSSHHEFQTAQHHYGHPVPCIPVVNGNKTCNSLNQGFYAISDKVHSTQVPLVNHENHGSKRYIFATANQNTSHEVKYVYIPAQDCDPQPPSASQQQTNCPPCPIPIVQNDHYTKDQQCFLPDESIALTDACNILDAAIPISSSLYNISGEGTSSSSQNIIALEHDNIHLIGQRDADKLVNSTEKQGYIYTVLLNSGSQREPSPSSLDSLSSMASDQEQGNYESQNLNSVEGPSNLKTAESSQPREESREREMLSPLSVLPVDKDVTGTLCKSLETGQRVFEHIHNEDTNDSIRVQPGDVQDPEDIEDRFEQCNTPPLTPSLSLSPLYSLPTQDNDSQLFLKSQQQVNQMTEKLSSCPSSLAFLCLQALASTRDQSLDLNGEPTEPFVSPSTALRHPPSPAGHTDQPCSTRTDLHAPVTMDSEPALTCFVAVASSSSHDVGDSHLRGWVIDTNVTDSMTQVRRSEVSNNKTHLSKSEDRRSSDHVGLDYETVDDVAANKTIDYCSAEVSDRKEEHTDREMCLETDKTQNHPDLDHNARTSDNETMYSVNDATVIGNLETVNETQEIEVEKQVPQILTHKATHQDADLCTQRGVCSPFLVMTRRSSRSRKPTAKKLQSYNQQISRKTEVKRQQLNENTEKLRGKHRMTEVDTPMTVNQGSNDIRAGAKETQQEMQKKENEDEESTEKHTDDNTYLSGQRTFDEEHISNECEGKTSVEKDSSEMQSHLTEKNTSMCSQRMTRSGKKLMDRYHASADSERMVSQTVKGKVTGKPVAGRMTDKTVPGRSNGARFRKGRVTENHEKYPDAKGVNNGSTMENDSIGGQLGEAESPQPSQEKYIQGETKERIGQDTQDIDPPSTVAINAITEAHSPHSSAVKLARHADEETSTDSKMTASLVNPEPTITETDHVGKSGTPKMTRSGRLTRSSAVAKDIIIMNLTGNTRGKAEQRTQDDDNTDLPFTVVSHNQIASDDRLKKDETETDIVQEVIIIKPDQGGPSDTRAVTSKTRRLTRGAVARREIPMKKYVEVKTESSKDYTAHTSVKGGSLQPSPGEDGNAETEVTAIAVTREVITEADKMSQTVTEEVSETHSGVRRSRRLTKGFVLGKEMEMEKEKLSTAVEKRQTMRNDTAPCSSGKASEVNGEEIKTRTHNNGGNSYTDERKIQQKMIQSEKKESEDAEREGDTKDTDAECSLKDAGEQTICLKPQEGETDTNSEVTVEDVEKEAGLYPLLVQKMTIGQEKLESVGEILQTNAKASPPVKIQKVDRPKITCYLNEIGTIRETAEDLTTRVGSNMKTHSMRTRNRRADRCSSESVKKTEERPNTSEIDQVATANDQEMDVKTNTEKQCSRTSRDQTQEGETKNTGDEEMSESVKNADVLGERAELKRKLPEQQSKQKTYEMCEDDQAKTPNPSEMPNTSTDTNKRQTEIINKQNTKERLKEETVKQDKEKGFEVNTCTVRTRSGKATRISKQVELKKTKNTEEWTSIDRTESKEVDTPIQTRSRGPARISEKDREIQRAEKVIERRVERIEAPQNVEGTSNKSEQGAMDVKPSTERQSSTRPTGGELQQALMEEEQTTVKDSMVMRAKVETRAQSSRESLRSKKGDSTNKLYQEEKTKLHAKEDDTHTQKANQDDRKNQTRSEATERCKNQNASPQRRLGERWSARIKKREKRRCRKY